MASSILNSNTTTVVLATAVALSGTVIVLALRLQKFSVNHLPRSCISSDDKKREKKKKKVHFADDVVDPIGNSEEFRKRLAHKNHNNGSISSNSSTSDYKVTREMAANRMVLYNGILRDRVVNRTACSY